ncbi:hypothetical protein [Leptospira sp. GIMC2001]|uniref:hypothetical protein n=1 Tax=Leptospira sp. GIMC2001 TaxID=1513297 RepID=UPI0023494D9B|nr:hypothetical protein [Leptospira sp. GIMC2001]WCL48685.1 hypothetical protein O4O04_15440 [Leptospira sp. GIMC2001]
MDPNLVHNLKSNSLKSKTAMKLIKVFSVLLVFSSFAFHCVGGGIVRDYTPSPEATRILSTDYQKLGRSSGESSTFFLFGAIPITSPLNMDYALSQALQKVEGGETIVNLVIWHDTLYYFPLGSVSVLRVEGDVIGKKKDLGL